MISDFSASPPENIFENIINSEVVSIGLCLIVAIWEMYYYMATWHPSLSAIFEAK